MLVRRKRLVLPDQVGQQRLLDRLGIAALHALQAGADQRLVTQLVARLAFGIGLAALQRQALQAQGGVEDLGAAEGGDELVTLPGRGGFGEHRLCRLDVGEDRRRVPLLAQPGQHRRLFRGTDLDRIAALQPFQLAPGALEPVLQAGHRRGVADLQLRLAVRPGGDGVEQAVVERHARRQLPLDLLLELGGHAVAEGPARVAGEHREVTLGHGRGGHLQVRRRGVGHVVGRMVRRAPVRPHVGTQQGEVAAVARPHEVVDLAAVAADRIRRRVRQPDVAQLQLRDQVEVHAVVHVDHAAAVARHLLAFGDQRLARGLHRIVVVPAGLATCALEHLVGDAVEAGGHPHPVVRVGGQFVGARGGGVAVGDQVALGAGVVLDHAEGDVVVGQQQPIAGDEGTGAPADPDHRVERRPGEVGKFGRITLETGLAQLRGDLRKLRGQPHPLVGVGSEGGAGGKCERGQPRAAPWCVAISHGAVPSPRAGARHGRPRPSPSACSGYRRGSSG